MSYELGSYHLEGPRKAAPKRKAAPVARQQSARPAPRPVARQVAAPRPAPRAVLPRGTGAYKPTGRTWASHNVDRDPTRGGLVSPARKAAPARGRKVVARKVAPMRGVKSGSSTTARKRKPLARVARVVKKGVKPGVSMIPGGKVALQAQAAGLKFKRRRKRGGGVEVVGVNAAGAVVTDAIPPNINVAVDTSSPILPETAVQEAASSEIRESVDRVRERVGRGRSILDKADNIRDRVRETTSRGRRVLDAASDVLDDVDTAGEAVVAGSRAAVATAATGNADTGLFSASLASPLVLGGIAVVGFLMLSGKGK